MESCCLDCLLDCFTLFQKMVWLFLYVKFLFSLKGYGDLRHLPLSNSCRILFGGCCFRLLSDISWFLPFFSIYLGFHGLRLITGLAQNIILIIFLKSLYILNLLIFFSVNKLLYLFSFFIYSCFFCLIYVQDYDMSTPRLLFV